MLSYALVTAAVLMFGAQFWFNERYGKESGNGMGATFLFSLIGGIIGVIALMLINGPRLEATPFTLLIATLSALNSIAYTFCSLKAFARVNLSLYSLFAMLGGMLLPFLQGILFYEEPITLAKGFCVLFIVASLLLGISKSERKGGAIYLTGVFVLNGMSGVLTKIFQASPLDKASDAMYSVWGAAIRTLIAGAVILMMLLIGRKSPKDTFSVPKPTAKALLYASGCGALNNLANFLLLLALAVLPTSVQYPFVTGGVMIGSTVISACTGSKPSKKEILAVALAFVGILALVWIPI